jgi:hypothetical protein
MNKNENAYKKYTLQAKRGIKGEAFFESLISQYALANHIVGPKDLGIDFICQWVYEGRPTEILFAVQIKTFDVDNCRPESMGKKDENGNNLEMFTIKNPNLRIKKSALLNYWKSLRMPVNLFAMCDEGDQMSCYYKRFTPVVTESRDQDELCFYKANEGTSFLAFADQTSGKGGFVRDLFIDYIRCCYFRGLLAYVNPRSIGLKQFPEDYAVFQDLVPSYEKEILRTYQQTKKFMERYCREQKQ